MQLYHHPFSLESQKVTLALEERNIDYTSYHVNPVTGKNMEPSFFRMNPTAKLPVFQNGSHVLFNTIEIIQYIERIALVSSGSGVVTQSSKEITEWMHKIQEWNPKFFTISHIPEKYYIYTSKFVRRVIIARMSEAPDLATAYHTKLKEAYDTEEKLHDPQVLQASEQHLVKLLDEVETQLEESLYLVGSEFTLADVMLVPILARLKLLGLEKEYISCRPRLIEYWKLVQQRPSYKKVIKQHFGGWRKRKTLLKTWCIVRMRCMLKWY
ncbi:glutathione S-transferase TCHQD-like [Bidens hawaiensis]|uniref:glutathione S-transferase TCHQD-like n=1 Tax=Bidens hawaiensis TaxID=980011 RepID=UPI004049C1BA